ncbi:Auxilin-related protein 1 [Platanthera zijinensis]|uniref:Auxilin-related protein 1 n=1 Tax=Platanthera zijinensis TaxID=2320716 RepID=A0AAP0GAS8_9ASPA
MERMHSSRPWRKSTIGSKVMGRSDYGDVLGGSQRHTAAPFSLQLEDYLDIFSSAASASTIPLLDLPPADNCFETEGRGAGGCGGGVDYADVFGMFAGGGFAASYEELFPETKRSGVSPSEGRTQWDVSSEQQEKKAIEHPPKGYNEHDTNLEMNQSSPAARHSYDVSSKKFMSRHRTSWEPLNVVISEKIQEAKLDAIPRDSSVADTNDPVHEMKNKAVHDEAAPHFSSSAKNSALNLKVDATSSESNGASLLVVSGDEKHHSRSSSYHSASSGDISVDDVTYLEVSEISLQTEPLQGPPPSRLPPEPSKKALLDVEEGSILKSVVNNSMDSRTEANNIRKIDEPMKDISCSDNTEMDPRSAIALSMAAVKEAMEQAQARLKSAKELMDRKRERCRRMNGNEDTSAMDANNLSEKSKMVGERTLKEKEEIRTDGKTALNHEEITVHLPSYKKDQQMMKDYSSDVAFKMVEIPREWKREKKYYELAQNDRFFNAVKDIYIQEDEKKEKTVICSGEEKENCSKNFIKSFEVEENLTSTVVSFSMEKVKKDSDSNCPNMAFTKETDNNLVDATVYEFLLKDSTSKLEDACGSHLSDDNQKMSDTTEDNSNDNKISELNSAAIDYGLHKESEKCLQNSNLSFEHEVDNKHSEKRQSKLSKGVSGFVEFERKFSASYLHSEVNDSYKEVTVPNEIFLQDIFVKEITVPDELFSYSTTDKKEVTEELKPFIDYVNETNMKHQFSYDGFRCSIEKGDSAREKNEGEGLQINEETLILEENELEQGVIQDEDGLEYLGMQEQTKNELDPILNCRSGCHRDCTKKESSEARTFLQEDEESMGGLLNQEVETSDFLESAQRAFEKRSSEETTEATVPYISVEKQISLSSADKTCQLAEIEESDTQVFLSAKEGNLPAPPQVSHAEMMEHHEQFCHEEDKHRGMLNIDRERDEEQAIRLEEKEKERESENNEKILTEQANYEAHQQALVEAQKRAERIAVERVTAEARQRALADAQEKAKKAAEAEKASREARLRAERAAVERATEEARRRAIEKALAEKAAAGIRERTAQVSFSKKDRMRKDNGTAHFKATHMKEDSEARHKSNSTQIPRSAQSQTTSSTNGHVYSDSYNNVGGAESSVRCKAGQEKQQQTAERAAQALSEKNTRDILAQREQAERDRLSESLDVLVRKWSIGKDGNLRLLLSTLQYILAPESGWQPIPLADIINAPAVKRAYRKATLCVHPDKLQQRGATIQQKYICEKVFDLLKEAWEKFNSDERQHSTEA